MVVVGVIRTHVVRAEGRLLQHSQTLATQGLRALREPNQLGM
jgi:hypothetical protein